MSDTALTAHPIPGWEWTKDVNWNYGPHRVYTSVSFHGEGEKECALITAVLAPTFYHPEGAVTTLTTRLGDWHDETGNPESAFLLAHVPEYLPGLIASALDALTDDDDDDDDQDEGDDIT